MVAYVPLDESQTKITAATLEWSNESNDVNCPPTVVILHQNDTVYDVASNDFLSMSGKLLLANAQKVQTQLIKIRITDANSVVHLSPTVEIRV